MVVAPREVIHERTHADGYDVVVIGGGAAGLEGALVLARSRRSVLVIDAGEPRNAPAAAVHDFLTRDGIPPAELARIGRAEVRGYGGQIVDGTRRGHPPRRVPVHRDARGRLGPCRRARCW